MITIDELYRIAMRIRDAGHDTRGIVGVIGEQFAMDQFAMSKSDPGEPVIDGTLPDGRTIQVKTRGPRKNGRLAGESEYISQVKSFEVDLICFVQLKEDFSIWRYALLSAVDAREIIEGQTQNSCNGTTEGKPSDGHFMVISTLSTRGLWKQADQQAGSI